MNGQHQTAETCPHLQTSGKKGSWTTQEKIATRRCRNRSNDLIHGSRWLWWWWWLLLLLLLLYGLPISVLIQIIDVWKLRPVDSVLLHVCILSIWGWSSPIAQSNISATISRISSCILCFNSSSVLGSSRVNPILKVAPQKKITNRQIRWSWWPEIPLRNFPNYHCFYVKQFYGECTLLTVLLFQNYWMAKLSVAQSPWPAVLPTAHGCHYAFQKYPFFVSPCITS